MQKTKSMTAAENEKQIKMLKWALGILVSVSVTLSVVSIRFGYHMSAEMSAVRTTVAHLSHQIGLLPPKDLLRRVVVLEEEMKELQIKVHRHETSERTVN